jgi:hypothetical protein
MEQKVGRGETNTFGELGCVEKTPKQVGILSGGNFCLDGEQAMGSVHILTGLPRECDGLGC